MIFAYQNTEPLFSWLLAIPLLLFSCNERDTLDPSGLDAWYCPSNFVRDSVSTVNDLLGRWQLVYTSGGLVITTPLENQSFRQVEVEFRPDQTLDVLQFGEITETAQWEIAVDRSFPNHFSVHTVPAVSYLHGSSVICGNKHVSFHGYLDGANYYFKRVE